MNPLGRFMARYRAAEIRAVAGALERARIVAFAPMRKDEFCRFVSWDLIEDKGMWVLKTGAVFPHRHGIEYTGLRFINVLPVSFPWTLAVDAALEFMDRLRTGRVRGYTEPVGLMADCVRAARRQR